MNTISSSTNSKIQFTRYLYLYEEVELSLLLTLLKKKNIDKMLFWCYELYYSTHENNIFPFLFKLYFDFYAIKNPKFYDYMAKNYKQWKKDKNCFIVGNICKNLFVFHFDTNVFTLRQFTHFITDKNITSYRGRKPTWLSPFDKKYHNLYLSIHKRNYKNVCYYLKKLDCSAGDKFLCIIDYFEKMDNATIIHKNIMTKLEEYDDFEHYVFFALILMLEWDTNVEVNNKKIYVTMNNEEKDDVIFIQEDIISPLYKTLEYKRAYKISNGLGCFQLKRDNNEVKNEVIDKMNYHWLYYCSKNAYWKPLLDEYTYKINDEKEEIEFENDDMFEDFHEKYGYLEPDEQNTETQDKSICNIKPLSWKKFMEHFSELENFVEFDDDFRFQY